MSIRITRRSVLAGAVASAAVPIRALRANADTGPKIHHVRIKSFKFEPAHITVSIGDTIRWTNEDVAPHTATAIEAGWDTKQLLKGESAEIIVTDAVETSYYCTFHPHMKGRFEIAS
ncbi:plastocyanin/azurin family copper-binding protein [Roseobacter sp. EG26]|uniref:plastocyanin/azurin family copper-binding protein n=1 Tax=Roseobacter sp. EG26 TaxID=3412477 RepID=UPI003CE524F2